MEFLQPLAVFDVALAPAHVVHVVGIDQHHLQPALLEYFVNGDPVDPGRLHRHRLDATLHQPVGEVMEVGGEGAEFSYWLGVAVARYGHVVAGRSTVDACGVGLNALEQRGRQTPVFALRGVTWGSCNALVLHAGLLQSGLGASIRGQGRDGIGTLLNGITTGVSPMTLSQHPMDHARERARSTTAKAVSVPGSLPPICFYTNSRSVSSMSCRGSPRVDCSG